MSGAKVAKKKTIRYEEALGESMPLDVTPAVKAHHWSDSEIYKLVCDVLDPTTPISIRDEAKRIVVHFLSADDLVRYRKEYLRVKGALPYI